MFVVGAVDESGGDDERRSKSGRSRRGRTRRMGLKL